MVKKKSKVVIPPIDPVARAEDWKYRFDLFDKTNTGLLVPGELQALLTSLNFPITNEELDNYIQECLVPVKGGFSKDDFLTIINRKVENVATKEKLRLAFELFDYDGRLLVFIDNGYANANEIKELLMTTGATEAAVTTNKPSPSPVSPRGATNGAGMAFTEEQCEKLFSEIKVNSDGYFYYQDLIDKMTK